MKRFLFLSIMLLSVTFGFAQRPQTNFMKQIDISKYEITDSLPIHYVMVHFNKEVEEFSFIELGDGDYLAPVPHKDNIVIKRTTDGSKAIVTRNSYAFGRHFEFNVDENQRRIVLWFKDKNIYCGYIYDKEYKVCKYFESKKEYKRFIRRPFFNRPNLYF